MKAFLMPDHPGQFEVALHPLCNVAPWTAEDNTTAEANTDKILEGMISTR